MTAQQIIGTTLRIAALWLLVVAFQMIGIVQYLFQMQGNPVSALGWAMIALPALLAVFLWMFPLLMAGRLLPRRPGAGALGEAAAAACVAVGILTVVPTLADLFSIPLIVASGNSELKSHYFQGAGGWRSYSHLLQAALACALMAMPRRLAAAVFPATSITTD